jgi:hypothetical protein
MRRASASFLLPFGPGRPDGGGNETSGGLTYVTRLARLCHQGPPCCTNLRNPVDRQRSSHCDLQFQRGPQTGGAFRVAGTASGEQACIPDPHAGTQCPQQCADREDTSGSGRATILCNSHRSLEHCSVAEIETWVRQTAQKRGICGTPRFEESACKLWPGIRAEPYAPRRDRQVGCRTACRDHLSGERQSVRAFTLSGIVVCAWAHAGRASAMQSVSRGSLTCSVLARSLDPS